MISSAHIFSAVPRTASAVIAACVVALAVVLVGPVGAASAHDELVATDPAAGAVLTEAPDTLTLSFSAELLPEPGATEVRVTDAGGTTLAEGAPVISGTTVTQALLPGAGDYSVLWRVVSSDGHPISGEYSFTVDAPEPEPAPTPTATTSELPSASAEPEPSASAAPAVTDTGAPASDDDASTFSPWIIGAIVGVLVLGAVVYLLVARARRAGDSGAAPKTDSHPGTGR